MRNCLKPDQRYFQQAIIALIAVVLIASGCAGTKEAVKKNVSLEGKFRIVVYPVENLSGNPIPRSEIRQLFTDKLIQAGFDVVGEEALQRFMARNRIRYTGGLDRATAGALKEDLKADGVLILSVELFLVDTPPKIALISRLVTPGDRATISWIDGVGLAGDDSPGILSLGLIEDPYDLTEKAVQSLVNSLAASLSDAKEGTGVRSLPKRFQPRIVYRSPLLETDRKYTIAIVPFFNSSERRNAGEILVLHFITQLKRFENLEIIEPGLIRQEFLSLRIIMEDGISLAQTDAVFSVLDADLILSGKVMDYQDYKGAWGKAKVDFFSQLIERKSRMVVWSSSSYGDGEEGVYFFDWGKVNTAYGLTSRMAGAIGEMITNPPPEEAKTTAEEEPVEPLIGN
jgi:TolB-like protein